MLCLTTCRIHYTSQNTRNVRHILRHPWSSAEDRSASSLTGRPRVEKVNRAGKIWHELRKWKTRKSCQDHRKSMNPRRGHYILDWPKDFRGSSGS